jgi:hypothetical protein
VHTTTRDDCGDAAATHFSPTRFAELSALDSAGKAIVKIPGLTHFYPLNETSGPDDVVGDDDGASHGAEFAEDGASFDGHSYIRIPDNDDFSVTTTGKLTIVAFLTIDDWGGSDPESTQYVHWMGKGKDDWHEWAFRHYVKGASGEAAERQGRTSFYYFNPEGGLGAGSYFQDRQLHKERLIVATVDTKQTAIWKNGVKRDDDPLSGFQVTPKNTPSAVCIGGLGDDTGSLVGKLRNVAFFNRELTKDEIKTIYDNRNLSVSTLSSSATPPPVSADTLGTHTLADRSTA